jgi:hypothetical protein
MATNNPTVSIKGPAHLRTAPRAKDEADTSFWQEGLELQPAVVLSVEQLNAMTTEQMLEALRLPKAWRHGDEDWEETCSVLDRAITGEFEIGRAA